MTNLCTFYCTFPPKIWFKNWHFLHLHFLDFSKTVNSEIIFISTSFKKEISIPSHIAKKLQALKFLQIFLSKKAPKKKCLGFLGKTGQFCSKLFFNSKISCISMSFKRRIDILSHIGKKVQARQFLQNRLSEKAPESKKFFFQICIFCYFSKTVLVIDLKFKFWVFWSKNDKFMHLSLIYP